MSLPKPDVEKNTTATPDETSYCLGIKRESCKNSQPIYDDVRLIKKHRHSETVSQATCCLYHRCTYRCRDISRFPERLPCFCSSAEVVRA